MTIRSVRLTVIAATAMIGLTAAAVAVEPPAAGEPASNGTSATATKGKPGGSSGMRPTIEQRIAELHSKLMITPSQQPQWDAFTQVMRDNAQSMEQTFQQRVKALPTMTAPENMQSYSQVAMNHATEMQKLVPAFQALYDTMSDSQKKTADAEFRAEAHHHHRAEAHHGSAAKRG